MLVIESIVNRNNLKKAKQIILKAHSYKMKASSFSDIDIKNYYKSIKGRHLQIIKDSEELSLLLALIKETFIRVINISLYDEQLLGAFSLYSRYITEMKTGEGKSITIAIAAILCSLTGRVHIATVNDYLAKRDYELMRPVFEVFGLTSSVNERENPNKKELYESDILYSSSMELIFDYLKNELVSADKKIQFPTDSVIIDEIDFVLLDNANSVFSVSTGFSYLPPVEEYKLAKELCRSLVGEERKKEDFIEDLNDYECNHYVYFHHNKTVYLTDKGVALLEEMLGLENIISNNLRLYNAIIYTLEANLFYSNGRDYIIQNGKIVLINQANGRLLPNSHLESDLHTAIEIKEDVAVTEKPLLANSLSYQIFFSKYKQMVGLSGTIYDSRQELEELFKIPTVYIPTHKQNCRLDHDDLIFKTLNDKYDYLVNLTEGLSRKGQPVLIIAGSEYESFFVQTLFNEKSIKQINLLNAQNTNEEAELVKAAGIHSTVTISTNISGRGTDIILDEQAKKAGGLFVIILNRNSIRRIDNQARGRAGRQGDRGECICLVSLEDELIKNGIKKHKDKIEKIIKKSTTTLSKEDSKEIERVLDEIQFHMESSLFKTRQMLFVLDSVIESRRKMACEWKQAVSTASMKELLQKYCCSDSFNEQIFLKLWNHSDTCEKIDTEKIQGLICEQFNVIGNDTADLLLKELFEQIFYKELLMFKRDLECIKYYMHFYRASENEILNKYIVICASQYSLFQQNVMNNLLGYFLSAKVKSVVQKN